MLCDSNCSTTTGAAPRLFESALNFFAATQCFVPDTTLSNKRRPDLDTHYDFIIVGAGSAGSVVANRLSEESGWNILLLEAGLKPPIESDIPYLDSALYQSRYNWRYFTVSDSRKHQGLRNGTLQWPRGKMLGGTSSINGMIYLRGRDYDYQSWVEAGNPSWTPENVNKYFKKAENFEDMKLNKKPKIFKTYGQDGPLVINSFNSTQKDLNEEVIDSWNYIGVKKVLDLNTAKYEGYGLSGITRVTARSGQRESTYRAYLKKATDRQNLKIVTNAFVTKILINNEAQAYGVEADVNGIRRRFFANREIILSAGSINSPQLLMLSGVGPEEHLLSKNITCIVNLPGVGKNLHDHISTYVPIYGDKPGEVETADSMFGAVQYLYNKTGYLANGLATDIVSLYSRAKDMPYPEYQSIHFIFWQNSTSLRSFLNRYTDAVAESIARYNTNKAVYLISTVAFHPFSRGTILLNTSNPYDQPIIDANYFDDDRDVQTSVDGIKTIVKLLKTPYFRSINAFIPRVNLSQCNGFEFLSDRYWECYALHMTGTTFPVGSAKMGPDARDSVVDNYLKVHGVRGLRVVDCSIMPYVPSANANGPTIMIGEMASDMIKADY